MNSKVGTPVPDTELASVNMDVHAWLNTWPNKPLLARGIYYNGLPGDKTGLAMATIQGTYRTDIDILGGYEVDYQFKVVYRIKPGNSDKKSIAADNTLNDLGLWCQNNPPNFSPKAEVMSVQIAAPSSYFVTYENGDEDHQIYLNLTYKIKGV